MLNRISHFTGPLSGRTTSRLVFNAQARKALVVNLTTKSKKEVVLKALGTRKVPQTFRAVLAVHVCD